MQNTSSSTLNPLDQLISLNETSRSFKIPLQMSFAGISGKSLVNLNITGDLRHVDDDFSLILNFQRKWLRIKILPIQNSKWPRQEIAKQRRSLPIASVEQRIVEEVRKNDTCNCETGSGKTTQLSQFLFNGGFCRDGKVIGITQPRRVAAVTVAKRVSGECGVELGQKVGYSIRFEDVTSSATRIKYMTDGMLLREALLDPLLSKYSVVILDEAHERTVHTDVLLGILKGVQKSRSQQVMNKDNVKNIDNIDSNEDTSIGSGSGWKGQASPSGCPLKLIVMSASLDARGFSECLGGAKAVHIQGRKYPVDILYTYTPQQDYIDAALITLFQAFIAQPLMKSSSITKFCFLSAAKQSGISIIYTKSILPNGQVLPPVEVNYIHIWVHFYREAVFHLYGSASNFPLMVFQPSILFLQEMDTN
ncbi:pre-mRNA-splicing factor ATP-dependent RNA helicase DEAH10-like [Nymphaea colorata]|nr:pre-mRNA-splicing factor ATP-dependent RNA helicase DEAH10-like [Nymphaea colorata]